MEIDWIKIRNEYISSQISQRKLAEKYNISYSTLKDRSRREKWADSKKIVHCKIAAKTEQKTIEKSAEEMYFNEKFLKETLIETILKCKQAIPILDRFGNCTGEFKFDSAGVNNASRLMAQMLGLLIDKKDIKHEIKANH